ncbi:hypothetical protein LA345_20305 [Burkholderia vietnamiensis]|nr:hypothetical protein [Burkholderia vietnamiensis]MCB4346246.1 hypothetical protein [Burkholderia vietnamiensis]
MSFAIRTIRRVSAAASMRSIGVASFHLSRRHHDATVDAASLELVDELTAEADMHDQVRAKLCKALGYAVQEADPPRALDYLRRALSLNDRVGVKKDIDRLSKLIEATGRPGDGTEGT